MIYLDNSATTRAIPQVIRAVNTYLEESYFNPSSAYKPALEVERQVNGARERLAAAMGVSANEIIFTSGGTESNNTAVFGVYQARRAPCRVITTAVEHASVFEPFRALEERGADVAYIGVTPEGSISMEELRQALNSDTALVSVMHVNNETGAINDIDAVYSMVKSLAPQALLHVDGVQAFNKLPYKKLSCDLYSISGHKFHGPKGVGALYLRSGIPFDAVQIGGGQERGNRSGTVNTPGIMGMDTALNVYRANQEQNIRQMSALKKRLAWHIGMLQDTYINGPALDTGAPHILNISFMGVGGEVLLQALCEKGIMVSTGSACSARKKGKNRILSAMGVLGERQDGAIRFSFSPYNTPEEIDVTAQVLHETVQFLRRYKRR